MKSEPFATSRPPMPRIIFMSRSDSGVVAHGQSLACASANKHCSGKQVIPSRHHRASTSLRASTYIQP